MSSSTDSVGEVNKSGAFFEPGGKLALGLIGYEDRPEQQQMSEAVEEALQLGHNLLVEAGTGTGKSLAYLLPAVRSGLKVVISTATRSLQDQLLHKDLPILQGIVDQSFEAVPLKGTNNYLCLRKLFAYASTQNGSNTESWATLENWAHRTETGDRAEFDSIPEDAPIWSEVTTSSENRLGPRCPHYERCFVTRARRRAESAHIVVVNHHLFFADLFLRKEHPGARVIPEYQAVIFDEAHGLEEVMTEHFGVDISSNRIEQVLRDWRHHLAGQPRMRDHSGRENHWLPKRCARLVEAVTVATNGLFAALRTRLIHLLRYDKSYRDGERFTLPIELIDEDVQALWFSFDTALEELYAHGKLGAECLRDGEEEEKSEELRNLANRCQSIRNDLAAIADRPRDGQSQLVFWGRLQGPAVSLHASPVSIDTVLQSELADKVQSLIFTSATLSAGGRFGLIRQRLGLETETTEELCVHSPFDYQEQCMLYLPRDIPESSDTDNIAQRHERIAELLQLTAGHAFVLFTSYRAMQSCYRDLSGVVPWPLLIQGQAPRRSLVAQFAATPGAVLLATSSFWEGVDVPGAALSHVLIDKLPFDVPSDPLNQARMARLEASGLSPFEHYQLPRATITFRQGFGRLIRRKSDRGIVSVLDPRIVTKRYGRFFIDSLPNVCRTSSLEQVRRWWSK